ncbi:hypothetical protein N7G274_003975 [Stereocaulon virgatum]|uniref:Mediator of RNA polymerase II transcription subunit 12 n=1 Tax=Stereocaulon virgatum TaxID=373712 RepID=A0ABR4AEB0_9LECA
MTIYEPPYPGGTRAFPQPSSRTTTQIFQPTPRSWPRQNLIQTPNAPVTPRDASEPALKRQKLDDTARNLEKVIAGNIRNASTDDTPGSKGVPSIGARDDGIETGDQEAEPQVHQTPLLPLRPSRDSQTRDFRHGCALAIERAARRDAVQIKPYAPEPPAFAPRFHEGGSADFFPWTGQHPEDVLTEQTTKSGFYDKLQVSHNESTTARPSVWSSLRHKSGIPILSQLFVSALDQRQIHGTITTNTTFKPPPRVTLTDTKREAWLRDLANPSIPLRRLSRTIPHGIRGKILLDHCLSKDIPTSRAIWLAKCVGANEIRAFKRKGTGGVFTVGGEAKWIKDWTTNVEQFLDSIISICGSIEWRAKIHYGLRLASHLYSEHLLDREQYLSWLIDSLCDSDLDSLPIWLLLMQIHQQEVLQHRQRGRRLAEGILEHLENAHIPPNRELYGPVLEQITKLIKSIMHMAPACFLLPSCWNKYQDTVNSCLGHDDVYLRVCFESLSRRNTNLQRRLLRHKRYPRSTCQEKVIDILDQLYTEHNFGRIAVACLKITHDQDLLVKTCLEWAASAYRFGLFRAYATARILRIWNKHGVELQQPIFDVLHANPYPVGLRRHDVFKVLAELVSSRHLSVGRYLQWLMACGKLQGSHQPSPNGPCDTGFLLEMPLQGLPPHVLNLRNMLLSTLGISVEQESNTIYVVKSRIAEQIPDFFNNENVTCSSVMLDHDYASLSQTVKSAVGRWIRQTLILRLRARDGTSSGSEDIDLPIAGMNEVDSTLITMQQFQAIRGVYEEIGEYAFLADFLKLLSTEVHGSVLTAVADTVNHYFDVFDAIGAADDLFRSLCRHQEDISGQHLVEKGLLESLIDLGCRASNAIRDLHRLRKELSACLPKPVAAACSPISDTMVDAVQSSEPAFADEMDQMLANGTNMDEPTVGRVFGRIVAHLERSVQESDCSVARIAQLLARVRGFGTKTFDALIHKWLPTWLQSDTRPKLTVVLPPMICSKIVSLKTIINAITHSLQEGGDRDANTVLALDTLELVAEARFERMQLVDYRRHRMLSQLHRLVRTSPASLNPIIGLVFRACSAAELSIRSRAQNQIKSESIQSLLRDTLRQGKDSENENEAALGTLFLDTNTLKVIGGLLNLKQEETFTPSLSVRIIELLDATSDFNIPLAQLELKKILDSALEPTEVSTRILSDTLIKKARSTTPRIELWASLVSELSMSQATSVRERAETELLSQAVKEMTSTPRENGIAGLVSIVEAAAFSVPDTDTSPIVDRIVESLVSFAASPKLEQHQHVWSDSDPVFQYIDVLLRLLRIHQTTIQHPKFSQHTLFQLLMSLALLSIHAFRSPHPTLPNDLFDTLSLLSDCLSDDTRSRCINTLRDYHQTSDPRLRFVFGYGEIVDNEWLQIITKSASTAESKTDGTAIAMTMMQPYPLRRWEMMQDATPVATENDTSLSLTLFGARKSVL